MIKKMNGFMILFAGVFLFVICNRPANQRKIKLSSQNMMTESDRQLTTTIHLEPTKRRSIAVMFFQNETGDQNLEWLKKGLTEMFIRSLSQSQYLSVLPTDRLFEILERIDKTSNEESFNMDVAAVIAEEANVEAVLTGSIKKQGDSLQINVKLQDPNQGMVLQEESVEGAGLETIFSMVDNLTQHIKQEMQISMDKGEQERGIAELSTNSLEAWRYYTTGDDFYNQLLIDEATEQFEKAVEFDPEFVAAHIRLFDSYLNQRKNDLAYQTLQHLKSLKGKATKKEKYQIDLDGALMQTDIQAMLATYQEWIEAFPDDIEANYNLANLYYGLHQYDEAIHYYERALTIDPKHKLALNMLGYTYAQNGNFNKAIATLEHYKKIAPDEPNPYDSLGEIYLYLGEFRKAEKLFREAIRVRDNFTASWYHLADVYLDRGKYNQAQEIFQEALQRIPEGPLQSFYYNNLALAYWRMGELDRAIDTYHRSLDNYVFQSNVFSRLYDIYRDKGDTARVYQELETYYQRMLETPYSVIVRDQNFDHLTNLSFFYGIHLDETLAFLNQAFQQAESPLAKIRIHFQKAVLSAKMGKIEHVESTWKQFDPSDLFQLFKELQQASYSLIWKQLFYLNQFHKYPERGIGECQRIVEISKNSGSKMFEMGFRLLLANLYVLSGEDQLAKDQLKIVGTPEESKWVVLGPFDNRNGFHKKFPPEKSIRLGKQYQDQDRTIRWLQAKDDTQDGYINFKEIFDRFNWSVAYSLIYVQSPEQRDVDLRIGSNEAVKVWLNNQEVWKLNIVRNAVIDNNIVPVTLKEGRNQILIKVCNRTGEWGFYFRITDDEGNGMSDIDFISPEEDIIALDQ